MSHNHHDVVAYHIAHALACSGRPGTINDVYVNIPRRDLAHVHPCPTQVYGNVCPSPGQDVEFTLQVNSMDDAVVVNAWLLQVAGRSHQAQPLSVIAAIMLEDLHHIWSDPGRLRVTLPNFYNGLGPVIKVVEGEGSTLESYVRAAEECEFRRTGGGGVKRKRKHIHVSV